MKKDKTLKLFFKNFRFLKNIENRKKIFISLFGIIVLVLVIFLWQRYYNADKKLYEVAVMVRDQYSSNSSEDARSSLKVGDVLVIKESGLEWSQTERVSYLILKMRLTEKQAQDITSPETKEVKRPEPTSEELAGLSPEQQEELKKSRQEPDFETVRPRKYRINMDKFDDFKPIDLLNEGQPHLDDVYGWGIVMKK